MESLTTPPPPTPSEMMDRIRDAAGQLSAAIQAANQAGISVKLEKAEPGSANLFHIVYQF